MVLLKICFEKSTKYSKFYKYSLNFLSFFVADNLNAFKGTLKWNISGKGRRLATDKKDEQENANQHIMISYNSASRSLCLKIKSHLEKSGFKVWIDVKDIHGSSLDSMARAVEDSSTVLICITEKYRQSLNCQAEAQYAFKLNKHIVPLIMEKDYENVTGWLGIIMSDKIFINFVKYDFDECMRRLKAELKVANAEQNQPAGGENLTDPRSDSEESDVVENWDEKSVKSWLKENKISIALAKRLMPCTGAELRQMYELKKSAPEFYYQILNSKKSLKSLKEIFHFSESLNNLFND